MSAFAAAAFAGIGAGLSAFGAQSRNTAINRAMDRNNRNAAEEIAAQQRIYEIQATRARKDEARTQGLVAVSAAERGVGSGGSTEALSTNIAIEGNVNQYALGLEHYGQERRTLATLQNTQEGLAGQGQSVALAALSGAVQGAQTGLSIGNGIEDLMKEPASAAPISRGAFYGPRF